MRKFLIIAIILVFWAVYYIQNHTGLLQDKSQQVIKPKPTVDVNIKKQQFLDKVFPAVKKENERVESERAQLFDIKKSLAIHSLTNNQLKILTKFADAYRYSIPDTGATGINVEWIDNLLLKVNVLPQALVATQAANESAWGTSRFAKEGNNYFGQWCYQKGCGLIPKQRGEGTTHEVAKFDSPQQSIYAYYMNVNSNDAYQELRKIRANLVAENKDLKSQESAIALTNGLLNYSERGQAYVNDLQSMIKHNSEYWTTNE